MELNESRRHSASMQTVHSIQIPEALLRIETVVAVTGLSSATIYRKVREGKFPVPVKDGPRCTRWVAANVSNWLRARAGDRNEA